MKRPDSVLGFGFKYNPLSGLWIAQQRKGREKIYRDLNRCTAREKRSKQESRAGVRGENVPLLK